MKRMIMYPLCFFALIGLFVLSLTLVYMIPNEAIEWHLEYSLVTLEIEETWESFGNIFGFHSEPGMLDNTTDRYMTERAWIYDQEMNALEASVYMWGYMRYWHGYQIVLRPLLALYQIHQIRYINVFVFLGLLFWALRAIEKRLGLKAAVAYFSAMVCAGVITIPSSMQFMSVFVITLLASTLMVSRYPFKRVDLPLVFMIIGMLTNFFDLLTAPVVTLGVPLMLCLMMCAKEEKRSIWQGAVMAMTCCVAWVLGYALCWLMKWIITGIVLDINLFEEVIDKITFYSMGANSGESVDRIAAVTLNLEDFFMAQGKRTMLFPLSPLLLFGCCVLIAPKRNLRSWGYACGMLGISLIPYVWYFVLAEHSLQHHWFTYRAQMITLFGMYASVLSVTDESRLKAIWSRQCVRK